MPRVDWIDLDVARTRIRELTNDKAHYLIVRPMKGTESIGVISHVAKGMARGSILIPLPDFPNPLWTTAFSSCRKAE